MSGLIKSPVKLTKLIDPIFLGTKPTQKLYLKTTQKTLLISISFEGKYVSQFLYDRKP